MYRSKIWNFSFGNLALTIIQKYIELKILYILITELFLIQFISGYKELHY